MKLEQMSGCLKIMPNNDLNPAICMYCMCLFFKTVLRVYKWQTGYVPETWVSVTFGFWKYAAVKNYGF